MNMEVTRNMITAMNAGGVRFINLLQWISESNGWINAEGIIQSQNYLIGMVIAALTCMIVPYLLGSINPAILISKIFYHEDIRNFGSGNAGTTNMLRTYGKGAAAATFLTDLAKAAVAFFFGGFVWGVPGSALAGFFVIFGHMFPIYYKFKGGKGVACLTVIVLLTDPLTFLVLLAAYIIIVLGTRYISLASVMCAFLYPILLHAFSTFNENNRGWPMIMAILSTFAVVFMHRENLKRLWNGKESKVSFSKTSKKKKGEESESGKEEDK